MHVRFVRVAMRDIIRPQKNSSQIVIDWKWFKAKFQFHCMHIIKTQFPEGKTLREFQIAIQMRANNCIVNGFIFAVYGVFRRSRHVISTKTPKTQFLVHKEKDAIKKTKSNSIPQNLQCNQIHWILCVC